VARQSGGGSVGPEMFKYCEINFINSIPLFHDVQALIICKFRLYERTRFEMDRVAARVVGLRQTSAVLSMCILYVHM